MAERVMPEIADGVLPTSMGAYLPRLANKTDFREPLRFRHPDDFKAVMLESLAHNSSDVFINAGLPICCAVSGVMSALTRRTIDEEEVRSILKWAADRDTAATDILEKRPVNGRYELFDPTLRLPSGARVRYGYRVNAYPVSGETGALTCQIVIRAIPREPPTPEKVGLPPEVVVAATPRDGIVYIVGATGSGKSTTFAAIMRHVLEGDTPIKGNIITGEDPIEFRFNMIQSQHSLISQSEVSDFYGFIREAMRRAPKLIMIGECRDQQTIRAAVEASLTGHTVFTTVHANDVATTMRRLITRFPEQERATAIYDIVETARFILAQRLVRTRTGGLTAAREYLVFDDEVREELLELTDMGKVTQTVKRLVAERGHSFKKEAKRLVEAGLVDEAVANALCH